MANQSLFSKIITVASNSRLILHNRIAHANSRTQIAGIKSDITEQIKKLHIPDRPKKPLTPYLKFSLNQRASIIKEHPDWKFGDITKKCASDWKSVDETIKQKYEEDYKKAMVVYSKKHLEYSAHLTDEQKAALKELRNEKKKDKKKRKDKKIMKETNKPKRPLGSYVYFVLEQTKTAKKQLRELLPDLKGKWANISAEEKAKYDQMAQNDKKRYEEEMKVWEKKMLIEGHSDLIRQNSLLERPSRLRGDGKANKK